MGSGTSTEVNGWLFGWVRHRNIRNHVTYMHIREFSTNHIISTGDTVTQGHKASTLLGGGVSGLSSFMYLAILNHYSRGEARASATN